MNDEQKRLFLIIGGAVIVLGLAAGLGMVMSKGHDKDQPMNTHPTGLQVSVSDAPVGVSQKTLRCFVNGSYVGDFSLTECAKKNGVAAQTLDVGLDDNGNPTAAPTASLAPPPAVPGKTLVATKPVDTDPEGSHTQATGPVGDCLRYASGDWSREASSIGLSQCAHLLYDGRCERPGSASYGRWSDKTLRLVPGRIEISDDNKNFHLLSEQGNNCQSGGH